MHLKRLLLAALLLAAACQQERNKNGVLVTLTVTDDAYRPEHVLLSWLVPGEAQPREHRFPPSGAIAASGSRLGTVFFAVDTARPGERRIVARGMRAEGLVSMAAARVPDGLDALTLTFGPPLPDADGDGLPDVVDDPVVEPRDAAVAPSIDAAEPDLAAPRAANGTTCTRGDECASGLCVDGVCCATACTEACSACNLAGAQGLCTPVPVGESGGAECPVAAAGTCGNDGFCDGQGRCRLHAEGTRCGAAVCEGNSYSPPRTCDGQGTCRPAAKTSCGGYLCASPEACGTSCTSNAQCSPPNHCMNPGMNGTCSGPKPLGAACTNGAECVSGECQQGVCCGSSCAKPCYSCAVAGSQGSCVPVPAGADPLNHCTDAGAAGCGTDGFCDGMGACRLYAGGTVCAPQSCAGSTHSMARTCNGLGACRPPVMLTCAPYVCGTGECRKSCTKDAECAPTSYCAAGLCVSRKGNGVACGVASECSSGFCSRGVCCNAACTGLCQSCVLPGAEGACRPIPDGQDPHNQCAAGPMTGCGTDGFCNGNNGCRLWRAGTVCGAGSCSNGMVTPERTCNGTGACQTPVTTSCGKYPCSGTGCRTSCGSNADCIAPSICADGACGGLRGEYFNETDFSAPAGTRIDPRIDFDWMHGEPLTGVDSESFSVRWTGKVTPRFSETYTFIGGSDDGLRVWVNGVLVIDNWGLHAYEEEDGTIALTAGRAYDLKVEFFDNTNAATVKLMWESPSQPREVVPAGALTPP